MHTGSIAGTNRRATISKEHAARVRFLARKSAVSDRSCDLHGESGGRQMVGKIRGVFRGLEESFEQVISNGDMTDSILPAIT